MDPSYIERERIVERYLAGELTVRVARDFERFCLENPAFLEQLPIPVRLKARLARRPMEDSESGTFATIPSSATRSVLEQDDDAPRRSTLPPQRGLLYVLIFVILLAAAVVLHYARKVSALEQQLKERQRTSQEHQLQAYSTTQSYRVKPSRQGPAGEPTLALSWPQPPQWLDLYIDVSEGNYSTYQVTVDKVDHGRVMQLRRLARDSNRELRIALNSSAFGPGDFTLKLDGYTWRGETQPVGWIRLSLK